MGQTLWENGTVWDVLHANKRENACFPIHDARLRHQYGG